jgi:alpha-N-arabinofuranosidase
MNSTPRSATRLHRAARFLLLCLLPPTHLAHAATPPVGVTVRADSPGATVNRNIYGHFAEHLGRCIYEGLWVGEESPIPNVRGIRQDVVQALRELQIPVLRWPGGCFADEYHWKDGIGPRDQRPKSINTHWGGVIETNHFGTHEFLDLCEQVGAEPYVCGNVGSGTVQEMMEWVEYMTSDADSAMANLRRANGREAPWKIRYFGVGNESWGCGGNMRPEYYADLYRRYSTFVKNYSGNRIYRIACGASDADYGWTEVLMRNARRNMNGLSLHYYTIPTGNWGGKGSATDFDEAVYHATLKRTLRMEELIARHSEIMDRHDPRKRVGMVIDEWGVWTDAEPGTNPSFLYQQNSLRDAIVAGLNLHIFQRHADRITMANIAQTVNVLQAMILTDGGQMLRTPTFHIFEMFKVHQGGVSLPVELESPAYTCGGDSIPAVSASATRDAEGAIHLSLINTDANRDIRVECSLAGASATRVTGRALTAAAVNAHNTFASPDTVRPLPLAEASIDEGVLKAVLPAKSVVVLELD